jgi:small-conductance mechanosensitive channel
MKDFLNQIYFNNTIEAYAIALGILIVGIILTKIFKRIILSRLKKWSEKTETTLDDFLIKGIEKSILPLLYYGAFYLGVRSLALSPQVLDIIKISSLFFLTFFILKFLSSTAMFLMAYFVQKQERGDEKIRQLRGMTVLVNVIIWVVGLVFLLDNIGFDITTVIAGLGIGGIAIALAAQAILGDMFSYFVIFFDRPFEVGDFINVGDEVGTVEYTGIKTTRIRALSGEQLVFSNTDLTNSRLHNYKKMEKRRVVFKLGVIYQTTADQLEEIPKIVRKIIEDQEDATFDRGHFKTYGDFSLNFEFVYYVIGADYNKYMDIQQSINIKIYRTFEEKGIDFAYPTQTIFLNKENNEATNN